MSNSSNSSKVSRSKAKKIRAATQSSKSDKLYKYDPLNFNSINSVAQLFASHIEEHFEEIADILLEYESFEVVEDETNRTLDHLRNLSENENYFKNRIGEVTAFLPRNQPLYALTCFVIIPSFMATEVHFRIPHSMHHFFPRLIRVLKLEKFFPNIIVSNKERLKFLKERSALRINPKTEESAPVTDAVIFTGTSHHADRLRLVFDQRTLFIANGSGHNPVVVAEDANISHAVEAVLTLQLYNQGQDCANPNAILVHKHALGPFLRLFRTEIQKVKVGQYRDRSCRVGPISDPEDLVRIEGILIENREWIDVSTPGIIRAADSIVEPTIICKPLKSGGNFSEVFSPIVFIQEYVEDKDLELYFEDKLYPRNAMYVTLYGSSNYIRSLENKKIGGKILHDKTTILIDTHLHADGIERGTQPYGGYGYGASSFSINGEINCKPTLPQRDIYEQLVKPLGKLKNTNQLLNQDSKMSQIFIKDVQKILGLKTADVVMDQKKAMYKKSYIDALDIIASDGQRYIEFTPEKIFTLLDQPNVEHMATMQPKDVHDIRTLRKFLKQSNSINQEEFTHLLYSIPKKAGASNNENKAYQVNFFKNVYQLLFGKDSGPRLGQFLLDTDLDHINILIDL